MMPESAREALARLADGNQRFRDAVTTAVGQDAVRDVLSTANPYAVILTCADSRVAPEILFGETLGQLFVVRVAGNVPGSAEIGSIEYALAAWSCPLVVVLGHTRCGAVAAVVDPPIGEDRLELGRLGHLASLLVEVRTNVADAGRSRPGVSDDERWRSAVECNLAGSVDRLVHRSNLVASRIAAGDLAVEAAIYDLDSGLVTFASGAASHPRQPVDDARDLEPANSVTADSTAS